MKTVVIITLVALLLVVVTQAFVMHSTRKTESLSYKVVKQFKGFEIRRYEANKFTYVNLQGESYSANASSGFRTLAGYIFGSNESGQKIAMTSPVAMNLGDTSTMMFMLPSKMQLNDVPKPTSSKVKFKEEPEKLVAAVAFGGWANDSKINRHAAQLKAMLVEEGIGFRDAVTFLGYNPPYELINRRNEVIIELDVNSGYSFGQGQIGDDN